MNRGANDDYSPIKHRLVGFYNRGGVCLLRGMNWILNKTEINFIVILEYRINSLVRLTDEWIYSMEVNVWAKLKLADG